VTVAITAQRLAPGFSLQLATAPLRHTGMIDHGGSPLVQVHE
jgi:hypothetical protein